LTEAKKDRQMAKETGDEANIVVVRKKETARGKGWQKKDRKTEWQRNRKTERSGETERDIEKQKDREIEREGETERDRQRQRENQRQKERSETEAEIKDKDFVEEIQTD
jgi:hypothetical protein